MTITSEHSQQICILFLILLKTDRETIIQIFSEASKGNFWELCHIQQTFPWSIC